MTVRCKKTLRYMDEAIKVHFDENGKFHSMSLSPELAKSTWTLGTRRENDVRKLFAVLDAIKEEIGIELLNSLEEE